MASRSPTSVYSMGERTRIGRVIPVTSRTVSGNPPPSEHGDRWVVIFRPCLPVSFMHSVPHSILPVLNGYYVPLVLILVHVSDMNISLYSVDNCFQLIANLGRNLLNTSFPSKNKMHQNYFQDVFFALA